MPYNKRVIEKGDKKIETSLRLMLSSLLLCKRLLIYDLVLI